MNLFKKPLDKKKLEFDRAHSLNALEYHARLLAFELHTIPAAKSNIIISQTVECYKLMKLLNKSHYTIDLLEGTKLVLDTDFLTLE